MNVEGNVPLYRLSTMFTEEKTWKAAVALLKTWGGMIPTQKG